MTKRGRAILTDDDRAILDDLVSPAEQTGVLSHDLVAAIDKVINIRDDNTRRGAAMINALHRDSGSWRVCEYLTKQKRGVLQRWGKKVVDTVDDTDGAG